MATMSKLEEGRQAQTDAKLILEGNSNAYQPVGKEADRNIDSLLSNLCGRSPQEATFIYEKTLYQSRRK